MASRPSDNADMGTTVGVVLRVASMHRTSISVHDLLQLLPKGACQEDVVTALESSPGLASEFSLRDGLIVTQPDLRRHSEEYVRKQEYSRANVETVRWLASKVGDGNVLTISVSGSTSYRAAARGDDVDLFCVTKTGTMWVFMAKALLFTRVSRLMRRSAAPICLSCIMDSGYARDLFATDRGALFARDALMTEVVRGQGQYGKLIRSAPWMERYFPRLYVARREAHGARMSEDDHAPRLLRAANLFLFFTLGSYIRAKAGYHNRRLSRTGKTLASFRARIGTDHLIYESAKYLRLREMYDEVRPKSGSAGQS